MSVAKAMGWPARLGAMAFALVFMLAFGAGGIWGGVLPLWEMIGTGLLARGYVAVPAQVVHAELVRHPGSKRSVTFEVRARYVYSWQGRRHEGTRIGLASRTVDNIGSWHADWHDRLSQAQASEHNVVAWVDPDRPERALLDRSLRWGLVALHLPFAVLFSGVAIGAGWFFLASLGGQRPRKTLRRKQGAMSGPPVTTPGGTDLGRAARGRLDDGGEVLFPRRWPRWVGVLMLLAVSLWAVSGPVRQGVGLWLAALPATAWAALAVHLLSLRWTWHVVADRLVVCRRSWLHERRVELSRVDLESMHDKLVYTSSTNGGPTVHHHALVARTLAGHPVALTPAMPDADALRAVRSHLRKSLGLVPQSRAGRSRGRNGSTVQ